MVLTVMMGSGLGYFIRCWGIHGLIIYQRVRFGRWKHCIRRCTGQKGLSMGYDSMSGAGLWCRQIGEEAGGSQTAGLVKGLLDMISFVRVGDLT